MSTATESRTTLRPAAPPDGEELARIMYDAFESIAARHSFPIEPGSREFSRFLIDRMLADPGIHGIVAEREARVVGSLFADERDPIVGIGPISVDPAAQDGGAGRAMLEAALCREQERGAPGVRLVQTAYHYRSLSLYAKLGFQVRELLVVLAGEPPATAVPPGAAVRPAVAEDLPALAELCGCVHGHGRDAETAEAVARGVATVVERGGRVTGYATTLGYAGHAVGETDDDLRALIAGASELRGLGLLLPARNAALLGWALTHGLRIVQTSTLMTIGLYNEPAGAWLPSILY